MLCLLNFVHHCLSWSVHQMTTTPIGILTSLLLLPQFKPELHRFKPQFKPLFKPLQPLQPLFKPLFKPLRPLFKPLLPLLPCTRYGPKTCRKL